MPRTKRSLVDVDGNAVDRHLIVGQVVGVHLDERCVSDGVVDLTALRPIARCGYAADYTVVERLFRMSVRSARPRRRRPTLRSRHRRPT